MSAMTDSTTASIAAKVRGVKAEKGLTNDSIAQIIGVDDRKTVGARLAGKVPFSATELHRFAVATDEPVTRFFPDIAKAAS